MAIEVRPNGTLVANGIALGNWDEAEQRLVLNLGWLAAAEVKLTVQGDPNVDRTRIVLARPKETKRLEHGDQLTIDDVAEAKEIVEREEAKV